MQGKKESKKKEKIQTKFFMLTSNLTTDSDRVIIKPTILRIFSFLRRKR